MSESEAPASAPPTPAASLAPPTPRPRFLVTLIKDFALAALLFVFVLVFLFQPFRVVGVSMLPEFSPSDRIIVNKLSYRLGDIQRGDVVVFYYPEEPSTSFIKRVIGLPGDRVAIVEGEVYVNDQRLSEPYLEQSFRVVENRDEVEVRRGFYYVLGDHRGESFDSRFWGLVPERYIYGKVVLSYWPPEHVRVISEGRDRLFSRDY